MSLELNPAGRALVVTGALLFLAGLLQGLALGQFANPRMALSAHLDAVQSGMAVMIAGILWHHARLGKMAERVGRWTLAAGMVGLWFGITLAAATGASDALPMAGQGFSGGPTSELVTLAIVGVSGLAILAGWGLFVIGLIRGR